MGRKKVCRVQELNLQVKFDSWKKSGEKIKLNEPAAEIRQPEFPVADEACKSIQSDLLKA